MTSNCLSRSTPVMMDFMWRGVKPAAPAYIRSTPLAVDRVQKIFDSIKPFQDKFSSALESVTNLESRESLERIFENPVAFYDSNKSGEFPFHFELRLAVDRRKIQVICPKGRSGNITCIFFYLKKGWNDVFASGGQKKLRLGCRLRLINGDVTVTADAKVKGSENEIEIYQRLNDIEGVVKIHLMVVAYSWKTLKSYQLYFMKNYSEGTLEEALLDNRLNERQKFSIVFRLIDILIEVHARNVSHNDLKLGNVLLDDNLMPYLADFGLSTDANDIITDLIGTPGNFPPQICPVVISRRLRFLERKLSILYKNKFNKIVCHAGIVRQLKQDPTSKKLLDQCIVLEERVKDLEKIEDLVDDECDRIFEKMKKFCKENLDQGRRIIPQHNDISALGFIIEDLFGRDFHPDLTFLVGQMCTPFISERIDLEESRVKLEKIQQLINRSRSEHQIPLMTERLQKR